jgi:hypothetical protein
MRSLSLCLLMLVACNSTPDTLEGQVVDVWGNPVEGATVMVLGGSEQQLTGSDGRYVLPRIEGSIVVKTGRKGFVQAQREVVVEPGQPAEAPLFELYPKPEEIGFFAVGAAGYKKLEARPVGQVGNALKQFLGLADPGEVVLETRRPRILYHNDKMRHDQIVRLGLQLRALRFVGEEQVPVLQGEATVSVNLYVDDGGVPITLEALGSRSDYLIVPKEDLEPGRSYALQTQGLLTGGPGGDTASFTALPEELRIAFPFTLR